MTVKALHPDYVGQVRDRVENFHGMALLYVGWDKHLMFSNPLAFLLPPTMTFDQLVKEVLPGGPYVAHPDWGRIDWKTVVWLRDGQPFTPDPARSLADNGLGHKSVLRLQTPGLMGIGGSCS